MNYDNLTVESIAQYCAEKSNFKINKADLESQIQHLINIEQAKQLTLTDVSQQRELLLGFQKSEWFDLYEQGVLEYKDAIEKYLA